MKRFFTDMNATLRGFLIIALIAGVVVVLSLDEPLATVGGLAADRLLPRDRLLPLPALARAALRHRGLVGTAGRGSSTRRSLLAVVDIGAFIGLSPGGPDALAFFLVLGACAYAAVRVWRDEHKYS